MERPYLFLDPVPIGDHDIKFFLQIDGDLIPVEAGILAALCENRNGCLNYFLAGYFHGFEELKKGDL